MRLDLCKVVPSGMRIGVRDKGQGTTLGILVSDTSFFQLPQSIPSPILVGSSSLRLEAHVKSGGRAAAAERE